MFKLNFYSAHKDVPGYKAAKSPFVITRNNTQVYFPDNFKEKISSANAISILSSKQQLCKQLHDLNAYTSNNYLFDIFTDQLSTYTVKSTDKVKNYLAGQASLEQVSADFISFCFKNGLSMDKQLTLQSFAYHNSLSDKAVKDELKKLEPKQTINLLGFGLDDGEYERTLAKYLIDNNITNKVKIFGFDPYAEKTKTDIEYIDAEQLVSNQGVNFDIIAARWFCIIWK